MERRHLLPPSLGDLASLNERINERKRLFYFLALLVAIPSIFFAWFFLRENNLFIRYAYPILIANAGSWMIGLLWRRIPLARIEGVVIITVGFFFLVKYGYHLFFENPVVVWQEIETISSAILILFILCYIMFHHQLAFRMTLIYTGLTLALGLGRLYPNELSLLINFIRLETRLIVIALLTFVLAKMKDDLRVAQQQADYWEKQANLDHLTQLPNRRMMSSLINQYLRVSHPVAILLIDIDDFKCFNDTYGHDIGDLLLSRVAYTLKVSLRATDVAARWGGEEFLVLAKDATQEQALLLAERLRNEVEEIGFFDDQISVSIGGTLSQPKDNLDTVLKRADNALYTAKAQGRNRVCWE